MTKRTGVRRWRVALIAAIAVVTTAFASVVTINLLSGAIYEFAPTMFHCKVMVVDDRWVSVGSTNFDNRSFHLNSEANLNVLDRGLALEERKAFERDRSRSRLVSLEQWRHRPRLERIGDWFAGLARSQL